LEGRLCLVCRDEKVPMTAPMAATCVRLGTLALPLPSPDKKAVWSGCSNWRREEEKPRAPGSSPAARGPAGVGLGRCAPRCFLSPAPAPPRRARGPRPAFRPAPGCEDPRRPLPASRAEDGAPKPAWRPPGQSCPAPPRAVREPRSARPCCRPPRSAPRAALGLGRGPIMNEPGRSAAAAWPRAGRVAAQRRRRGDPGGAGRGRRAGWGARAGPAARTPRHRLWRASWEDPRLCVRWCVQLRERVCVCGCVCVCT
jgi:hypothetical protein